MRKDEAVPGDRSAAGRPAAPPAEAILVVCDTPLLFDRLSRETDPAAAHFVFAGKADDILSVIGREKIRTAILAAEPGVAADEAVLRTIKGFDALVEVIIAGPPLPSDLIMDWIGKGAMDYLPAPYAGGALRAILDRIGEKRNLRRETYLLERELEKKYAFHGIMGKSPFMFEVYSQIEKIAGYFTTVLITGETGTGKELAARAIHGVSPRRNRPLVICDCVAMPENLFESELFGYERGAFTGADRRKRGLFEEADGGTILLDEIGELPLGVQAKLLRVLETRQFRPLGATDNRTVDVRIIAATNRDLRDAIQTGAFREDLFHRLSRIEIHLPPLRRRPEDIPLLIRAFLMEYAEKIGKKAKGLSREAQKALQTHAWPGNIRELKNVVEGALLMCQKDFIDIVDLPKGLQVDSGPAAAPPLGGERILTLEQAEREHIVYVLAFAQQNLRKTAALLDISRSTLYQKLKRYGIPVR